MLIYLTVTRLDLFFTVGVVSQFIHNPCVYHWNVVIPILRYLKKVPGQGIRYEDKGNIQITGYCDSNWADRPIDKHYYRIFCFLS